MFVKMTGIAARLMLIAFAGIVLAGCASKPKHTKEVHYREQGEVIESTTPIVE